MQRTYALLALPVLYLLSTQPVAAGSPQADDPPVKFRSDVSLGRVDVEVVDSGNRPVRGIRAQDFVLRVDGKPQEIRNFESEKMPVDVLLLLDVSHSMEPHIRRVATASHQALRPLLDQDRVATMVFDRFTRLRMPFRSSRLDVDRELESVLDRESFQGGTDITRGLLDAAWYVEQNARRDARRAIVIVTDDQTERSRNEAAVLHALTRADSVLSALIAPDALHTGAYRRPPSYDDDPPRDIFDDLPRRFGAYARGSRTQSAGTANIANQSGGDSMAVDQASAFEQTLERIRDRYALYFYLPEGMQANEEHSVEVLLTDAARRRYPGADVRYRRSYLAPNATNDPEPQRPVRIMIP